MRVPAAASKLPDILVRKLKPGARMGESGAASQAPGRACLRRCIGDGGVRG